MLPHLIYIECSYFSASIDIFQGALSKESVAVVYNGECLVEQSDKAKCYQVIVVETKAVDAK